MSKISEQNALEAYPIKIRHAMDSNRNHREGYTKGYDQAMQDFLEKACEWLCNNSEKYVRNSEEEAWCNDEELVNDFKKYMENE